ncbi:helix-turn-helix domain-containing protein [Salinarimonas chemoclinalis]|uniref:helix-turn-helix domain-containing protein n=1 Tax=Salinarimonas chemoclinalis TaxID=3241599 RepID=UPI00355877D3
MELEAILGANVRALREARGFTQAQLGERAGVSDQLVGLERAEGEPTLKSVKKIAAALGVDPLDLFSRAPPVEPEGARARLLQRITTRVSRLGERELEKVDVAVRVALE